MTFPSLKVAGVMAVAAAIAMAGVSTAAAAPGKAPHAAAPFAAQVKAAGLNTAQSAELQKRVDQIVHQYAGAKQVAANEIALPHGDSVLLPLPGQTYARVLPGAVNLGFAPATTGTTRLAAATVSPADTGSLGDVGVPFTWFKNGNPADGPGASCSYYYLCMWQGQWGAGEQFNVSTCNEDQELPGSGWNTYGSWVNNQTPGTQAFLLNSSRSVIYTVPALTYNSDYNWAPVWYADACNH
ncbi:MULTISPECIES: hypothetical protein [Streptacidiphilus]|uniref:Peptidase inhibitor family I36 protein n=1 Tax=Streptacidiphilus cavernicola TaxID=3342716 RepID=A0ABV6UPL6_9ACTN|nr:hypothetical protein [Streptacidiphilus jeojiense]